MSGALIGIAGAVGAFGGVLVNLAFRQSFLSTGSGDGAYLAFIAFYAVCVAVTWVVYLRPGNRLAGVYSPLGGGGRARPGGADRGVPPRLRGGYEDAGERLAARLA